MTSPHPVDPSVPPAPHGPPGGTRSDGGARRAVRIGVILILVGLVVAIPMAALSYHVGSRAGEDLQVLSGPEAGYFAEAGEEVGIYIGTTSGQERCAVTGPDRSLLDLDTDTSWSATVNDRSWQSVATFTATEEGTHQVSCDLRVMAVGPRESDLWIFTLILAIVIGVAGVGIGGLMTIVGGIVDDARTVRPDLSPSVDHPR